MRHATLITALAAMACTPAPSSDVAEPAPPPILNTGPPELADTGGIDTGTLGPVLTRLDVIAVVDNTNSMLDEQARLADAFARWDPGVAWTLHVLSTDSYEAMAVIEDPGTAGAMLVKVGLDGNPSEQGLSMATMYLSHQDALMDGLVVVFLSDEHDSSSHQPEDLAVEMDAVASRGAVLALVSGAPTCYGAVEPGYGYLEAVDLIGGVHEEVCAPDYLPALQEVMGWI